jgi:hypothetical protein
MNTDRKGKAAWQPRLDALPEAQRRLWTELGATPPGFVLYGGTALALRLGHRQSVDFDFFSSRPFVPAEVQRAAAYLKGAEVQQSSGNTLVCLLDRGGEVQVAFLGGLAWNRVEDPERPAGGGPWVASLLDLAATKMKTIMDRANLRDYLDIAALLVAGIDLPRALGAAKAVFGPEYNPMISLKALTFFDEGDVKELDKKARQRLTAAARAVDLERLPTFTAKQGLAPSESEG